MFDFIFRHDGNAIIFEMIQWLGYHEVQLYKLLEYTFTRYMAEDYWSQIEDLVEKPDVSENVDVRA